MMFDIFAQVAICSNSYEPFQYKWQKLTAVSPMFVLSWNITLAVEKKQFKGHLFWYFIFSYCVDVIMAKVRLKDSNCAQIKYCM